MSHQFLFEGREIRVEGTSEEPLFVAADVCAVLDIQNHRQAVAEFAEDERGVSKVYAYQGQSLLCVTEAGLYRLIFRSNKPQAEQFRRWVFHEVLPAIRRDGGFALQAVPALAPAVIERRSVLLFLHESMPEVPLPPQLIKQFGFSVRSMAKALGVRGLLQEDPLLGEALAWPVPFLETMAKTLPAQMALKDGRSQASRQVEAWCRSALIFTEDYNLAPTSDDLFTAYGEWCGVRGLRPGFHDLEPFCCALTRCYPELRERRSRNRVGDERPVVYRGVALRTEAAS